MKKFNNSSQMMEWLQANFTILNSNIFLHRITTYSTGRVTQWRWEQLTNSGEVFLWH